MAQAWGVVILFDALHVIGFGVMAQAWGAVISPELGDCSGFEGGEIIGGVRNCSGFEGGEIIGGVRPHGVGSSGEWGRVSPGPEPQQIGEHVQGCGNVQSLRCAGAGECASVQGPGGVQDFGRVQMCKGSDVQGWGCVQMCRVSGMCKRGLMCKCVELQMCVNLQTCEHLQSSTVKSVRIDQ